MTSKLLRLALAALPLLLASCMSSALRESQHKSALPARELGRKAQVLTGRGIDHPKYEIYRFQGWLVEKDSPRTFDLYLPKDRSNRRAALVEVADAKPADFNGRTIEATFDRRHSSEMMLEDGPYRKDTPLVVGESIPNKGKCVSVGLRERGTTRHWQALLNLEWVERDRVGHAMGQSMYAVTVPFDVVVAYLGGQGPDDAFFAPTP